MQILVDAPREIRTDTGDRLKQVHRIQAAPKSIQMCPVIGYSHLCNRGGNVLAYSLQSLRNL